MNSSWYAKVAEKQHTCTNILTFETQLFILFYIIISNYSSSTECTDYKYGLECSSTCGNCLNGVKCIHVNGSCPNGCDSGVFGDKCDQGKKKVQKNGDKVHYISRN